MQACTAAERALIEALGENKHVCIERIISTGHASPDGIWYDHDEREGVVVLKDEAWLAVFYCGN